MIRKAHDLLRRSQNQFLISHPLLGPLRYPYFTLVWVTGFVSNVGSACQVVGATWLMVSLGSTDGEIAMAQAASTLPIMLLSMVSGILVDTWDARYVMLVSQLVSLAGAVALLMIVLTHGATSPIILGATFVVGCGVALFQPAWQGAVVHQVPRLHLSAAVALDSLSLNVARAIGPAIAGYLVLVGGPSAALLANTVSYLGLLAVLARPPPAAGAASIRAGEETQRDARLAIMVVGSPIDAVGTAPIRSGRLNVFTAAIQDTLTSTRRNIPLRSILIRSFMFGLLGSSVWALTPVIAKQQVDGTSATYGWFLASFGAGAVFGAYAGAGWRAQFRYGATVRACTFCMPIGLCVLALSPWALLSAAALAVTGACWVGAVSTLNVAVQGQSARGIVGRNIALFHTIIVGGLSLGSGSWGLVSDAIGANKAVLVSGLLLALSVLSDRVLPVPQPRSFDDGVDGNGTQSGAGPHGWGDRSHTPVSRT